MTRSMDQLQRLHNEFDVTNAAAPEFYVALELLCSNDVALNAMLDTRNLIQQIGVGALWVNERLMLPQEFVSELTATGDSACFDERKPFPSFAEPSVIIRSEEHTSELQS